MTNDIVEFAQVMGVILMFIIGVSVVGLVNKYLKRRMERPLPPPRDDRLERLEQAVDAIAIEVERVSEAQRYTTKLLAERHEIPAIPDR